MNAALLCRTDRVGREESQLTTSPIFQVFTIGQVVAWDNPTAVPTRLARLGTILGYSHAIDRYLVLPQGLAAPRWIKGAALRGISGS